jgi:aminopeptidase N
MALDRALGGGPPLDPTLARSIVALAAGKGDAPLYEALMAAADRASTPEERYLHLYSVAKFRNPALIERALQHSLSPKVRSQDTVLYLSRFLGEEAARPHAWTFIKEHWAELEPKIRLPLAEANLVGSLAAFCDARSRDDITTFFATHKLPSASRALEQTIERINNCIELRERQTPVVAEWVNGRQSSANRP